MSMELQGWIAPENRSYSAAKYCDQLLSVSRMFCSAAYNLLDSGKGKIVILTDALAKLNGGVFPLNTQTIGSCVGDAYSKGVEVLTAVEVMVKKEPEQWPGALVAVEWIYGASRVIQGKGSLGPGDGSIGAWAQAAVKENGTLLRKVYGKYDLTQYSGQRIKSWGGRDFPHELESIADEHPVQTTALVTTYEEARDSIVNGYPVIICSNRGFNSVRDSKGFLRPQGTWNHAMLLAGIDDYDARPGGLIVNSWGPSWVSGPTRHNQPEGSFWADADVIDKMLRQKDSYSLSSFKGYPSQEINHNLW